MGDTPAAPPHVVFGGTFDPVHDGHLAVARTIRGRFGASVHFLPAGDPAHRSEPGAPAEHRLAMLKLALADDPGFVIDTREIRRGTPSRTIDTVEELDRELPAGTPILLTIGMDSLRQFTTWLRWRDILARACLVACARPGEPVPGLSAFPPGRVLIETTTAANISATEIRAALVAGRTPPGLAPAVHEYIARHRLYAPGATNRA